MDEDAPLEATDVRDLLRDQHPDLAGLVVSAGPRGWDNQMWRLGDELAVRLPWKNRSAEDLLLKEHAWLPELAPTLSLPVPIPQRLGLPSERYPFHWIVTTWGAGTPADVEPATSGSASTDVLIGFWDSLHHPAPDTAPVGRGRGGSLRAVAKGVSERLPDLSQLCAAADPSGEPIDVRRIDRIWEDALAAPQWEKQSVWLHGDLHPANVLTLDGTVCGVVDFGDLCAGDPALDLASCWILLPDGPSIRRVRSASRLASDEAAWRRGRGWAIWRALGSLSIALAKAPGGKQSWGRPAIDSLRRLTAEDAQMC